jgi:quinol monooxygenase YgiN
VNANVTVIARVRAKPGCETKVKQECLALVAPSREEKGCINYDLYQSSDDPTLFFFYENWKTRDDIERHLKMPHCAAFDERTRGLLAEPEEITFCEMVA